MADKNLKQTSNPQPQYAISSAFSDEQLVDIMVDVWVCIPGSSGEVVTLIRAREEAQAALATAAARAAFAPAGANNVVGATVDTAIDTVAGATLDAVVMPVEGVVVLAEPEPIPLPDRAKRVRRVATLASSKECAFVKGSANAFHILEFAGFR